MQSTTTWIPPSTASSSVAPTTTLGAKPIIIGTTVKNIVAENAVVVIGRRGCCMCLVVKQLLLGLGVNLPVVDVDDHEETTVINELSGIVGVQCSEKDSQGLQFPAVFLGGKLFGGVERVMATHISGELVPILKQAGVLWL